MENSLRKRILYTGVLLSVGAGLVGMPVANAYIPPSEFILKTLSQKHLALRSVRIVSQLSTAQDSSSPSVATPKHSLIYIPPSRMVRSILYGRKGQIVSVTETPITRASFLVQALLSAEPALVTNAFRAEVGDAVTLGRENSRLFWVLGSNGSPQVWIEKDQFLPLKFVGLRGRQASEVQVDQYRLTQEFWFPRQIDFFVSKSSPVIRQRVTDVRVDTALPGNELSAPVTRSPMSSGEAADDELIQVVYDAFR